MGSSKSPSGKWVRVPLRECWPSEPKDFTRWLATPENLQLLAEALQLEFGEAQCEVAVGNYRADILCKRTDAERDEYALIENQLAPTDHDHLGKLLVYASGLKARTVVWIAEHVQPEHRTAINWLNDATPEDVSFFAVEIELWRIGNSEIAPRFSVVCSPDNWGESVRKTAVASDTARLQLEFWQAFFSFMGNNSLTKNRTPQAASWIAFSVFRPGFHLSTNAKSWEPEIRKPAIAVSVGMDSPQSEEHFRALENQKTEIEKEVGEPMVWYSRSGVKLKRIYLYKESDFTDRAQWPSQHQWLRAKVELLQKVFAERIAAI